MKTPSSEQVAEDFASEFGLDERKVAEVFDRAAAKLTALGLTDAPGLSRRIVEEAVGELRALGLEATPIDDTALATYIGSVPEPDRTIFNQRRSGKAHQTIAELMGLDKEAVLRSLARTYADLRCNRPRSR